MPTTHTHTSFSFGRDLQFGWSGFAVVAFTDFGFFCFSSLGSLISLCIYSGSSCMHKQMPNSLCRLELTLGVGFALCDFRVPSTGCLLAFSGTEFSFFKSLFFNCFSLILETPLSYILIIIYMKTWCQRVTLFTFSL